MRKPKDCKYNIRAWSNLPCPIPEEQKICDCSQICGNDNRACVELEEFQTNNKMLFVVKLFLCRLLYDYIEISTPENKTTYEV